MLLTKRLLLRLFFTVEIGIFAVLYLFGTQGLQALMKLRKKNTYLSIEVQDLEKEVKKMEETIESWKNDPFYKESVAREQLHMAKKGDQVYLR